MSRDRSATDVVIVGGARTAIGRFGGALANVPAPELGAVAIRAALERSRADPALVDEVFMGCVVPAGQGQAPARQAALKAGLPPTVGATTLNKVCGSGLKSLMLGAAMIRVGDAQCIVAGGMESMDLCPYLLPKARFGYRLGHDTIKDSLVLDGLWCAFQDHHMGNSAEWIAREFGLARAELDAWALESHRRAVAATDAGRFQAEIAPVPVAQPKGAPLLFDTDECPRRDTSPEALARLRPAFQADGVVTAGNSPGITDGAAATVLMSRSAAQAQGVQSMARVLGYAQAAVEPLKLFTAPVTATERLMQRLGSQPADFDLFEINEAFAAQTVANVKALGLDPQRVNVHGGAIALGHPIGCSGTRVLVTLLYALRTHGLLRGVAVLCLGGGEAVAMAVELEGD
ncbi:MAG: thiolase family protein [Chloroflexi bacterium]|nr:thiolase family protein [Chloroflexota bacterium]